MSSVKDKAVVTTPMNTAQLMAALAAKYKAPEWAFMPQVADATGFAKARTADALAMSLWPSRGLSLHGFEVKASRGDWKKELDNPAKAESICQFCDYWWVVVGEAKIVQEGELPPTWGLLAPKGKTLVVVKQAPELKPAPMTRLFLAAILRKAAEYIAPKWVEPVRQIETDEWKLAYDGGYKEAERNAEDKVRLAQQDVARMREAAEKFQQASGLYIDNWNAGRIGEAVAVFMNQTRRGEVLEDLKRRLLTAEREVKHCREQLAAVEDAVK